MPADSRLLDADTRLLDAASRLLAIDATAGMSEIADAAGISRATLHRRYPNRDALEQAIFERAITQLESATAAIEAAGATGRAALEALIPRVFPIAQSISYVLVTGDYARNEFLLERSADLMATWMRWIEAGQRRGEIRIDLPARWVVEALHGLGHAALLGIETGVIASADAVRLITTTLFHGASEPTPLVPSLASTSLIGELPCSLE
jgi:AcrR family transcriptional regulator